MLRKWKMTILPFCITQAANRMPRYVYKCGSCGQSFITVHGMTEDQDHCEICFESSCVSRIPQMPFIRHQSDTGKVVKEHITEAKEELEREKKRLASREGE